MKTYKQDGYVFITVAVIVTILISTLTIAISNQNKKIELIQNYEQLMTIEEEISAEKDEENEDSKTKSISS